MAPRCSGVTIMNAKLKRPMLAITMIAAIAAAFFCGVGAESMLASRKADNSSAKKIAGFNPTVMISTNNDLADECGVGDKIWQPMLLDIKPVQNVHFAVQGVIWEIKESDDRGSTARF